MSEAWNELQALKNKKLSLREKIAARKELIAKTKNIAVSNLDSTKSTLSTEKPEPEISTILEKKDKDVKVSESVVEVKENVLNEQKNVEKEIITPSLKRKAESDENSETKSSKILKKVFY